MELIDWGWVARGALWIMGLSLVLATCSYASWQSAQQHIALRKVLSRAAYQAAATTGLSLFAAGLAWGAVQFWERLAWIGLALAFAGWAFTGWRAARFPDIPDDHRRRT